MTVDTESIARLYNFENPSDVALVVIEPTLQPARPTRLPLRPVNVLRWGRTLGPGRQPLTHHAGGT
jgi:hypothetical protein